MAYQAKERFDDYVTSFRANVPSRSALALGVGLLLGCDKNSDQVTKDIDQMIKDPVTRQAIHYILDTEDQYNLLAKGNYSLAQVSKPCLELGKERRNLKKIMDDLDLEHPRINPILYDTHHGLVKKEKVAGAIEKLLRKGMQFERDICNAPCRVEALNKVREVYRTLLETCILDQEMYQLIVEVEDQITPEEQLELQQQKPKLNMQEHLQSFERHIETEGGFFTIMKQDPKLMRLREQCLGEED